ncbi:DUF4831 family protein [Puteibacter caeruleilacunae]|nr:DUF4831 family protein [Puteibacter caeruleilacunae]
MFIFGSLKSKYQFIMRNRSKALLLIALFAFCSMQTFAKDDKKKGEAVPTYNEGVAYSLPRTVVGVKVIATQKKFFHGPYFQYAERFLGITNAPSSDNETWTIDRIELTTMAEPDPAQTFKAMGTVASEISLTPEGILAGINTVTDFQAQPTYTGNLINNEIAPSVVFPDLSLDDFYLEVEDSLNGNSFKPKTIEERAFDVANNITKLRKRRFLTLAANYEQLPPDGKAYEVMVKQLTKMENEYVALFTGKTVMATKEFYFTFVPESANGKGQVIFRFSNNNGVVSKTDLSGSPVMAEFSVNKALQTAQQKHTTSTNPAAGQSGVYYRMPGNATVKITDGVKTLALDRITVAQFGKLAPVPENILDGTYGIEFHPLTGAIKNIFEK